MDVGSLDVYVCGTAVFLVVVASACCLYYVWRQCKIDKDGLRVKIDSLMRRDRSSSAETRAQAKFVSSVLQAAKTYNGTI